MYAVIENGGKQYRVELGSELELPRLSADPGAAVDFDRVLLVAGDEEAAVGRPLVEGARVTASVVRHLRGEKVVVFKYRPKARHRSKSGSRADLTLVRIDDIQHGGRSAAREAASSREAQERQAADAAAAAERQAEADRALAERLARESADSGSAGTSSGAASTPAARRRRAGSKEETSDQAAQEGRADQAGTATPGPRRATGRAPKPSGGASASGKAERPKRPADRTQAPGAEAPGPRRPRARKQDQEKDQ